METREKLIGDGKYQILLPSVRVAMQLCTRVTTLIGPVLAGLGLDATSGGYEKVFLAIQSVDSSKADSLLMDAATASQLSFEGNTIYEAIPFEKHFSTRRKELFPVLAWCLWEIVSDFFPELETIIQKATAQIQGLSKSQEGGVKNGG